MTYSVKNILWATDFSAEATNALAYAVLFAKTCRAGLSAIHVQPELEPALLESRPALLEDIYKQAGINLGKARKRLDDLAAKKGVRFAKVLIEAGSPAKKIIEAAAREKADLIVIGKTGLSTIEKVLVGSVANAVLRHAPAPVLIAGKRKAHPGIRKILVPTDFSEREEVERDFAWSLASAFKADLTLLHALVLHDYRVAPEYAEGMLRDVLERLKKRKAREKKGFQVHEDVVRAMSVAGGIVNYAEANKFDLIAISTTTHSKLARFFLGSNTERVISYSEIPIFAIPAVCSED